MLDTIANMPLSLSHSFFTVTILRSHVRSFFNLFSLFLDSTTVAYLHALALHGSHSFAFTASQPHCLNSISYQFSHFVPFLFLFHTFFLIDSVFFHAIFFSTSRNGSQTVKWPFLHYFFFYLVDAQPSTTTTIQIYGSVTNK